MGGYSARVPKTPRLPRYTAKSVGDEVEAARVRLGIPVDDLWERIGLTSRTHWYSKVRGDKPFRWEEVGKLAAEFQAPKGWPLVPWDEGLAWERWLRDDG